ncbi:uncharacterized protein L201_005430 [Kwoniella dendrophila CBS 6074]|uniref:SIT4-associating protein/190 n=1 Tax=Kwoniella dendrophila CBS 6074 TaxID=1295534 RepID=A0AAX4JZ68_9TREE
MLWRFSFASNSTLDALLTRDIPPSLEEILDEQDILNECKSQNNKLVSYLSREDSIKSLLTWVVAGLDELNQQAEESDKKSLDLAINSNDYHPTFQHSPISSGPNSPHPETTNSDLVNIDLDNDAGDQTKEKTTEDQDKDSDTDTDTAVDDQEGKDEFDNSDIGILGGGANGERRKSEAEEDVNRSRYPNLATEILCCAELWSVSETIIHNSEYLLGPFWDAVLPPLSSRTINGDPSLASSLIISRQQAGERERARNEFWDEKDEEREKKREMIRGMWMRVNGALMTKRTPEMIRFIQSIPNVVERLVARISSPAVQDILIRIVSSEEGGVTGVIDWLANEGLIPRLLEFLSPQYSPTVHSVIAEILKSIITLCAPTPFNPHGGNAMDQQQGNNGQIGGQNTNNGSRDNRLIRELISESNVKLMIGFILDDIELSDEETVKPSDEDDGNEEESKEHTHSPLDPFTAHPLPSIASATSSLTHICSILVEIIRRNNSDFSEPHLFHTLRQRLMNMKNQSPMTTNGFNKSSIEFEQEKKEDMEMETEQEKEEKDRRNMEETLSDLSSKMGIVHLGHLLDIISERFDRLHHFVKHPRSQNRSASSAQSKPFTIERFRILELYAELLHSSNMSILNRIPGTGPIYTEEGILSGGLEGLEALGEAIEGDQAGEEEDLDENGNPNNQNGDDNNREENELNQITKARELPVSSSASTDTSLTDDDDDETDAEILENIDVDDVNDITPSNSPSASKILDLPKPSSSSDNTSNQPQSTSTQTTATETIPSTPVEPSIVPPPPSQADGERLRDVMGIESKPSSLLTISDSGAVSNIAIANSTAAPSITSSMGDKEDNSGEAATTGLSASTTETPAVNTEINTPTNYAPGDKLKKQYIQNSVIPTVVELFFEYPNNDFMHHVVYDLLQQILNGRLNPGGLNSQLVIELIVKAKLVERVLDAQRLNDRMIAQPKSPRLAYMGHIILISEELVKFFNRCPPELYSKIKDAFNHNEWESFVETSLNEAKAKDTKPLAGGKPMSNNQNGSSTSEGEGISSSGLSNFNGSSNNNNNGNRDDGESSSDDDDDDDYNNNGSSSSRNEQMVKFGEPLTRTTNAQDGFINRGGGDNDFDDFGDDDNGDEEGMDRFWRNSGVGLGRRPVDSSDDDDDADWLQPSSNSGWGNNAGGDDDDFGAWETAGPSRSSGNEGFDDDDGWGNFASGSPSFASPNSNAEDPFGDDNFVPSVVRSEPPANNTNQVNETPLTPADWAEQFDRAFRDGSGHNEDNGETDENGVTAIVVPNLEDEDEEEDDDDETGDGLGGSRRMSLTSGKTSSWKFSQEGDQEEEDDGLDLPPTISPTIPQSSEFENSGTSSTSITQPVKVEEEVPNVAITTPQPVSPARQEGLNLSSSDISTSPIIAPSTIQPINIPGTSTGSGRKGSTSSQSSSGSYSSLSPTSPSSKNKFGEAFSPPDPSVISAATKESPLGPGVSKDTTITKDGLLSKTVDGKEIHVPKDEIIEAIESEQ